MDESSMYIAQWKKPIKKGYLIYESFYITFWKSQNYRDGKHINACQGFGMGGIN